MKLPVQILPYLPGFSVLCAVLSVQLPLNISPWLAVLSFTLMLAVFLSVLPLRKVFLFFALPGVAAFFAAYPAAAPSGGLESLMIRGKASGEFEIRLTDPAISNNSMPRDVRAEVRRFRLTGDGQWRIPEGGSLTVVSGLNPENNPQYGDTFRITGVLSKPEKTEYAFDYGKYLHRTGIDVRLRCNAQEPQIRLETGRGIAVGLLSGRNRLLNRLTESMASEEARALCEGILFGFTQNISPEVKQDFIRTGTIHILSVSGTHVGLFAALLLLLFSAVPFRLRLFCVIVLTFFYAWLTGLRGPSFRAAFMLAFFLGSRLFLLRTKPMNTLMLAAAFLLILNPAQLYQSGFLYSFLTVAALITVSPGLSRFLLILNPAKGYLPQKFKSVFRLYAENGVRKIIFMLLISLTAGVAGFALTVYFQGIISALSVLVNFCMLPLVWLCFPAVIPGLFGYTGILENLLLFILECNSYFAESGIFYLPRPPLWSIFLFSVVFFLFLCRKKWGYAAVLILIAGCWYFYQPEPEILLIGGGGSERVAVIVTDPAGHCADILNMPDYTAAVEAAAFLNSRGIRRCRFFTTQDHKAASFDGFPVFAERIKVDEAVLDSRLIRRLEQEKPADFPVIEKKRQKKADRPLTNGSSGDTFRFVFPGSETAVEISHFPGGTIRVKTGGQENLFLPSLRKEFRLFPLKQ